MKVTYFDIETAALPEAEIASLAPEFAAPTNYKDPAKVAAYVAEQKARWVADAALSPITSRVLCVGFLTNDLFVPTFGDGHEKLILQTCWDNCREVLQAGNRLVGFCCKHYDLPYLIKRSYHHGVPVPAALWHGRYFTDLIVDVAELWSCGSRDPRDRISLDNLSKFLGTGAKNGEGKDFAGLWASDRPKALAYLENDLRLTKAAYERMHQ